MTLLKVIDLEKRFKVRRGWFQQQVVQAVHPISFELNERETLGIIGSTGAGKSTLTKMLAGVTEPTQGDIYVDNHRLEFSDTVSRCNQIRMIFQDPNTSLNPRSRIGRILEAPLALNTDLTHSERKARVLQTLTQVGLLQDHAEFYPQMLSSGQKQRVALARALILNPKVIVADEALVDLDVLVRSQVINLLTELQETLGVSYIFSTNNLGFIYHLSDKVMVMENGECVEFGPTSQIFGAPQHEATQRLVQGALVSNQLR